MASLFLALAIVVGGMIVLGGTSLAMVRGGPGRHHGRAVDWPLATPGPICARTQQVCEEYRIMGPDASGR